MVGLARKILELALAGELRALGICGVFRDGSLVKGYTEGDRSNEALFKASVALERTIFGA